VPKGEGEREWRLWLGLGLLALVVAYVIAFVIENSKKVTIHWVFASSHSSVIWLIVVNLIIGVAAGLLISSLYRRRRRRRHPVESRGQPADSLGHLGGGNEAERKPG
jgi:uncharacterized membrane protein YciS (DUF1049 family)